MTARPDLVAGDGFDDTRLMRAVPGLVSKGGAEAIGVVALADGRAVALKVADGGERARLPVMLAMLHRLGVELPADAVPVPAILGHGRPVGATVALVP
jgi:L-asparaginase II